MRKKSTLALYSNEYTPDVSKAQTIDRLIRDRDTLLRPDWRAWGCQFYFGYPLGVRSHFQQVSLLSFESSNEQHDESPFLLDTPFRPYEPDRKINDFSIAVSTVAKLLLEAVERGLEQYRGKQAICFLSGGWDSRAIAACMAKLLPPEELQVITTSYDSGNDKEERFAEMVAEKLGLDHRIISLSDNYYVKHCPSALSSSDYSTFMHIWMEDLLEQLDLSHDIVNFDGYAGDLLLRGMKQQLDDVSRSPCDEVFFSRFKVFDPSLVLSTPVARTLERMARDELRLELMRYPSRNRILWFLLNNRGWRGVAHSPRMQMKYMNVALPFLDKRLFDYILSIDESIRLRPDFYPSILSAIDPRLDGLPSTNDKNPVRGWQSCEVKKFKPRTVNWMIENISTFKEDPLDSGNIIDWFSIEPTRHSWRDELDERRRINHLNGIESLNLYSLWLKNYQKNVDLDSVLSFARNTGKESIVFPSIKIESDFDLIEKKYLKKSRHVTNDTLYFHYTMDVEAFPLTDAYSYHTASDQLINRLIYSDFGNGSVIEKLFHENNIPCTYFLETYSSAWENKNQIKHAACFFKQEFSDVGLHCHAFSIPQNLREEIGLDHGWFLRQEDITKALVFGKSIIDEAIGSVSIVYRSGRLDIYQNMETAIGNAGFTIDSSLVDGYDAFYFANRSCDVGNSLHRRSNILEIPITSYRARDNLRLLDFNSSSFEEMCFVIVRALELGLSTITMLMHSWSLSNVYEFSGLAKGFHYSNSKKLEYKFLRFLEFLHKLDCVNLATLRDTAAVLSPKSDAIGYSSTKFDFNPPPLRVFAWKEGDSILGRCELSGDLLLKNVEFAFYLLVEGERQALRWYEKSPEVRFASPRNIPDKSISIRGFVRDIADSEPKFNKVASLT